jgi:hypothetical protein
MAAVFDVELTKGQGFALPWPDYRVGVLRRRVDFSATGMALAQTKVMSLFKIPADCMILKVGMDVITAQAGVPAVITVDFGLFTLAGDADGALATEVGTDVFGANQTMASTGYKIPPVSGTYELRGADPLHVTAANSVIAITNDDSDTIATAVVDFYAVCMNVTQPIGTTPGGTGSYTT